MLTRVALMCIVVLSGLGIAAMSSGYGVCMLAMAHKDHPTTAPTTALTDAHSPAQSGGGHKH